MTSSWRPMRTTDIADVIAIAATVHPGYPERDEVLEERLILYPEGCFILQDAEGVAGYILSHPWLYGNQTKLDQCLGALPEKPST